MAKIKRDLLFIEDSQKTAEKTATDKFSDTQKIATKLRPIYSRISPQISCTILPEDRELLNEICMYAIQKKGRPLSTSHIVKALIRLGHKHKDKLEF